MDYDFIAKQLGYRLKLVRSRYRKENTCNLEMNNFMKQFADAFDRKYLDFNREVFLRKVEKYARDRNNN